MIKYMSPRNRPNFNTDSGLTPTGRGPVGERPGSAPERNETGSPRASRSALRRLFAPGTPASAAAEAARAGSGGPPADAELAATLGRPGRAAAGVAAELAAAGPPAGVEAEASSRTGTGAPVTGPDVEPDVVPTAGSGVQVLAAAARSRAFTTSPPAGLVAGA